MLSLRETDFLLAEVQVNSSPCGELHGSELHVLLCAAIYVARIADLVTSSVKGADAE